MAKKTQPNRWFHTAKPWLFVLCLVPLLWIGWDGWNDRLGANPIETITRRNGDWALRLLCITLAMTPLRLLSGLPGWVSLRRMFGLYTFFYAFLHVSSYVILDQFFSWGDIWRDIVKRPYITVGFICFLGLLTLAVTSTHAIRKRLASRWLVLHSFVYPISALALLHYFWMVKADTSDPLIYALILWPLLVSRFWPQPRRPQRI